MVILPKTAATEKKYVQSETNIHKKLYTLILYKIYFVFIFLKL